MKRSLRNANIGIASSIVVLVVGTVFFHDSEGAMEALAIVTTVVAFGVLFFLEWRDERTQGESSRRSP